MRVVISEQKLKEVRRQMCGHLGEKHGRQREQNAKVLSEDNVSSVGPTSITSF